jgi:hypothetical protein
MQTRNVMLECLRIPVAQVIAHCKQDVLVLIINPAVIKVVFDRWGPYVEQPSMSRVILLSIVLECHQIALPMLWLILVNHAVMNMVEFPIALVDYVWNRDQPNVARSILHIPI